MPLHSCELCGVRCSSAVVLADHLAGRKHALAVEMAESRAALAARSVFLTNVYGDACVRGEIERAMSAFGAVDRILLDRTYGGAHFAIVEFQRAEDAQNVLQHHRRVQIGNCLTQIRERKMDFNVVKSEDFCDFTCAEVVDVLRGVAHADDLQQIDALVAHFALSAAAYAERVAFAEQLSTYLQQFFSERILVRPFGSTTTELAFYNSDLDLNFIFTPDNTIINVINRSTAIETPSQLLEIDIETIATEPISKATFMKLNGAERAQLLTKMINQFRKQSANIASITSARNARYPVVRFDVRLTKDPKSTRLQPGLLVCDLSVENKFSDRKANFIAEVCRADVSGRFQRFLFFVKLWAYCNRLLSTKTEEHKPAGCPGRWKSYTLSLLAVAFLQSRGYLPALEMRLDTMCLAGWPVDCDLPPFDLSGICLSKLLKEFFVFLYNTVRDSNVHSIREAKVVARSQFKCDFTGCFVAPSSRRVGGRFRMALANVQDPFELSHNVAATVSRDALTHFRRVLMFSIVALKQQHEQRPVSANGTAVDESALSSIFRINELEMSFVSSTSDNSAQNALHRKSANILVVPTGAERPPVNVVFDAFVSLLQDVLLIELVEGPPVKRFRQRQCGDASAANDDNVTALRDGRSAEFLTRHYTWLGRRQLRRKLTSNHLTNLPPLLLEREVSKGLCVGDSDKQPELFRFGVQLHLAEVGSASPPSLAGNGTAHDDSAMDDDDGGDTASIGADELRANTHNDSADAAGSEMYVIFWPAHDSSPTQCKACRDLMHFLSTFLAKHLPMLVGDVMKTMINDTLSRLGNSGEPPLAAFSSGVSLERYA